MSMATHLQNSVTQLRGLIKRGNGDIFERGPALLADIEAEIERVRGLEDVAPINSELLAALREKMNEHTHH